MSEKTKHETTDAIVRGELVGAGKSAVMPGTNRQIYGSATLHPGTPVEARSFQTFTLTYTVGSLGIDDTGSICVCFRMMSDFGALQSTNPLAPGFVTASCSGSGKITLVFDSDGGQRPFNKRLLARLDGGFLNEGEQITVVFGDTSQGSPGMLMQTFVEAAYEFRVMVDAVATRHFEPLDEQLYVPVVAGPPVRWKGVLPSLRRKDEKFHLGIKAEDLWGNPTRQARGDLKLVPSLPVKGLPETISFDGSARAQTIDGLQCDQTGVLRIDIYQGDEVLAQAGPLIISEGALSGYWGDLHGQSGETIGIGKIEDYFHFARHLSFLDVTGHQGNDFQMKDSFWERLNEITKDYDEPGRFVAFPGYEWSGNTAVGGDHNIFYRKEGRPIYRSSHALLADRSSEESDANTLSDLYKKLADEDCVMYAHVGGRYANIAYDHDPKLETAVELHSAWGSFEWMLTDAFDLGYRVGAVCNSDGHKGRPGASYPGASTFGSYGGLTCFLTDSLDRDAIFEAMRRRHHYGTTGERMHLSVETSFSNPAKLYVRDPSAYPDAKSQSADVAMMGDIVATDDNDVMLRIEIEAAAPIERVEIRNGRETLHICHPYSEKDLGGRVRVVWGGAEYRGRGRNTPWRGHAQFDNASITKLRKINAWNHERRFEQVGSNQIIWDTITTGNFTGFDAWLDRYEDAHLKISTNRGELSVPIEETGLQDKVLDAGGLERKLRVFRLPEDNTHRSMTIEQKIPLQNGKDNPLWVCVTTQDGHQAWSSPIYILK